MINVWAMSISIMDGITSLVKESYANAERQNGTSRLVLSVDIQAGNQYQTMLVHELINILKGHDPNLEIFICSEDNLWQINIGSFREATLHGTENGDVVELDDYDPAEDGAITETRESLLIDLDL